MASFEHGGDVRALEVEGPHASRSFLLLLCGINAAQDF